ncbi:hypothetical protein BU23DRAFT_464776 [Bimuria novae-zelandiae CBS 107.79]|uniref:Rad21/Rec8-like protein N-terminal domain-containing protein n=1 Tax=Bimuria novae-zelandiae CBS 107.79 TaxID=1447943 RepID=A0A6A5V8X3_9PLEO|nr:hypothetical protein BU23DRAFT_464776 [Bimuria novae-zelandiae CBS 107.79]
MFYPTELLQRSGPLAHVWLAANAEKKLTKQQVLQDKIEQDINEIMRPQAPFSLRLSGSLMFGVVRIYSRKARYLLDDCTDALWRIKMAFKPGNIDLPTNAHVANPAALILQDAITDIDLLAPMPDPSLLLSQSLDLPYLGPSDLSGDWEADSSQFLSTSVEQPRAEPEILDDSDDLNLDLGEDLDIPPPLDEGTSIEIGRDAPLERRLSEEFGTELGNKDLEEDVDLGLDLGDDLTEVPPRPDITITTADVDMGGMSDLEELVVPEPEPERERSASPLSELGEEEERALEQEVQNSSMFQPAPEREQEEEEEEQHQARAKRRRVIQQDAQTQLSSTEIRAQQNNREDILKPVSFLPRDPLLMALMNMQKSGGFVSSILGDGRSQGWAPELRGILSLEVVSRPAQKRKRDSGVAAAAEARASAEPTPQLEFEEDQPLIEEGDIGLGGDSSLHGDEEGLQLPEDEPIPQDEEEEVFSPIPDNFDDTTAPILHPAESGVVSLETKHAVHLLRQVFGDAAETSEEERLNTAVSFQGLFPEATTAKPDIARMFNEILVLGTKDAIKVEQRSDNDELGGPIRIRAKRGLWGSWAETDVSGAEAIKKAAAAEAGPAITDDTQATATSAAPIPSAEIFAEA